MKQVLYCLLIAGFFDITGALTTEQDSNSILNHRFSVYGGAQFYQAGGEFSSTKDNLPKNTVDLDDLG